MKKSRNSPVYPYRKFTQVKDLDSESLFLKDLDRALKRSSEAIDTIKEFIEIQDFHNITNHGKALLSSAGDVLRIVGILEVYLEIKQGTYKPISPLNPNLHPDLDPQTSKYLDAVTKIFDEDFKKLAKE